MTLAAQDNLARKPIYIPATQPEEEPSLRVAAYCRVSSDSDDQLNSFAAQQSHYYDFIHSHDHWKLADIYADEGITGTAAAKRDDFQRMLSDCRKGRIDKILVKSVSRFARNTTDCLEALRELKALGISVYFEEQNIDTKMASSEMMTAVIAACAQAESESISKNIRWGIQKRMRTGTFVPSSVPYGYRLNEKMLVIDEDEAAVVRRIYEAYLEGSTPIEIAGMLVLEGNTDRQWHASTIQYILTNERYIGDAIFQKRYTTETLERVKERRESKQITASKTEAQKALRRKCGCRVTPRIEQEVLYLLNSLAEHPERITMPQKTAQVSHQQDRLMKELDALLQASLINNERAEAVIMELAAIIYEAVGPEEYETYRMRQVFQNEQPRSELDARLINDNIQSIQVDSRRKVRLILKNGQVIERGEHR